MKKYIVLAASIMIQACLGGIYAWSVFATALADTPGLTVAKIEAIFGICIGTFPITMIFAGRLLTRTGPRIVAFIGGALFLAGYRLAAISNGEFGLLALGIGVIAGAGIGFGYVCPLATCVKWFPRRKGLVSGLAVAGFGGGAVVCSTAARTLIERGHDVFEIFGILGTIGGAVVMCSALLLFTPNAPAAGAPPVTPRPTSAILGDPHFWSLFLGIFSGTFAGLFIVGNLEMIGTTGGVTPLAATAAVAAFAVGNALGRILWGCATDGKSEKTVNWSLGMTAAACVLFVPAAHDDYAFVACALLNGFCFGGCFVIYVTLVAQRYGEEGVGRIYPLVFLGYGIAGAVAPITGGYLFDLTGDFAPVLVGAAAVPILAVTLRSIFSPTTNHIVAYTNERP